MKRMLTIALAFSSLALPAQALEIRSDLPLWGGSESRQPIWPQHFQDEYGFGCVSELKFGDWRFREADDNADGPFDWMRISNYGVFHCAARFGEAYTRDGLAHVHVELGYLVGLGEGRGASGPEQLYALQIGLHASRYLLLAAPTPAAGAEVERYRVLDPDCPHKAVRKGPTVEIFLTSYCAVADRATLIAMARDGVRKPSDSWLERVGDFDPPEDD